MSNRSDARFAKLAAAIDRNFIDNAVAIVATVGNYAVSAPAIVSTVESDSNIVFGGVAESGGYDIQMRVSDFSAEPPKGTAITCNGPASGKSLKVHTVENHGAVYIIRAVDFASLDT